jgi:hypothetical protein
MIKDEDFDPENKLRAYYQVMEVKRISDKMLDYMVSVVGNMEDQTTKIMATLDEFSDRMRVIELRQIAAKETLDIVSDLLIAKRATMRVLKWITAVTGVFGLFSAAVLSLYQAFLWFQRGR